MDVSSLFVKILAYGKNLSPGQGMITAENN
jgi:hypothetical protein